MSDSAAAAASRGPLQQNAGAFGRPSVRCLFGGRAIGWSVPIVPRVAGYPFFFFFFSNERREPAHIHVERAERYAMFWLADVSLASSRGFRTAELAELRRLVFEHRLLFQEKWDEHFSRST
jgi:hypothetical protein